MAGSHKAKPGDVAPLSSEEKVAGGRRKGAARSKRPLALGLAAVVLTGVSIGGYAYANRPSEPEAPVLTSAPANAEFQETATELCADFTSIECEVVWEFSDEPVGDLLTQTPEAGSRSETVELAYSKGPAEVSMPILAGLTGAEVEVALWEAGLELGEISQEASSSPAGTVVSASVEPAKSVANGTVVDVVVSTGRVTVPDWTGKTREFIEAEASSLGIQVVFKEKKVNEEAPGIALNQSVKGKAIASDQTVTVVISKLVSTEKAAIPTVVGKSESEAVSLLASAGFLKIKTVSQPAKNVNKSTVTRVAPEEGTEVLVGQEITLYVATPAS